jgi:hypothetical protein
MLRFILGVLVGVAAAVAAMFILGAFQHEMTPSLADTRIAAAKVIQAAGPTACCKRVVHSSCTSTSWSVCVVTLYIPEPLDACQDWSVNVHHHFVTGPQWLETYGCS